MDEAWLTDQLRAGRSIESLARETGRAASTVAYWAAKYGLVSTHAARHAARGGLDREVLEALVAEGLAVRGIAERLGVSAATVRYWLRREGLETARAREGLSREGGREVTRGRCARHGVTTFVVSSDGARRRCRRCRIEAVSERRRRVKRTLVREAGGCCAICRYDRCIGALQFHHRDPREKRFSLAGRGLARSLAEARAEAGKCVLLCANCHAEVEAGLATIPTSRGFA